MTEGRVLIVDDEPEMCSLLEADLGMRGFACRSATSARETLERLAQEDYDVVLSDLVMPELDGVELCDRIAARSPEVPVVVMTAFGSMDVVIDVLRASAFDFVTKPIDMDLLVIVLRRAVEHRRLVERVRLLSHPVEAQGELGELLGSGPAMKGVRAQILRVAPTDASVLVTGESGTGKELVARAICKASKRKEKPFVVVNCAALPASLVESELFGHERGAFTDARSARKGLFREAHGGTLFLDEVGEIPLELQPKLLRALEDHNIRSVGSAAEVSIDVRIIAATNRDLPDAVAEGTFRQDLYYRIQVVEISVPPLRERGADVLELARHFVAHFAESFDKPVTGISEKAAARIVDHAWPGNVRELRNAIERAVALTPYERIAVEDLPEPLQRSPGPPRLMGGRKRGTFETLEELERRHIFEVLGTVGGRRSEAARILGLDRKTLYRKLKRFEEEAGRGEPPATGSR